MRKSLILGIVIVLFVSLFSFLAQAGGVPAPDPANFVTYISPNGLFEVMIPKELPLMKEHKEGVVYGSPEKDMIIAAGVRLFNEKDEDKVDLKYIQDKVSEMIKDITVNNQGKVIEKPKEYKGGIYVVIGASEPPFPPKEKVKENEEKPEYYVVMFIKPKNEKSLAILTYLPKSKYLDFKKDIDFMIDNLK